MKKLIFLLLIPFVSFAQNDSVLTSNKSEIIITCKKCDNSKKPLYFIEGKLVNESEVEKIDPDEIESINVLKREKAIEKYGDEGKNRVIEIHLKNKEVSISEKLENMIPICGLERNKVPEIYEIPIDYNTQTYYGLDFEYKLFMFFKFMEDKHKISFI